jgi:hypothetical protein
MNVHNLYFENMTSIMPESTTKIINEVLDDIKENIDQDQQMEKLNINSKKL